MEGRKKNKILAGVIIAVLAIGLVVLGVIFGPEYYQKSVFLDEMERLSKINILEEDIDMEIKSSGEYAKVEEAAKEYFSELSIYLREISAILSDESLNAIVSEDILTNDAPNFSDTLETISEVKEKFNTNITAFSEMMTEEAIMAKIQEKNPNEEFEEIYREAMMNDEEIINQLETVKQEIDASKINFNSILDYYDKLYRLLAENSGKWEYGENGLQISDSELLEKYQELLNTLPQEENQ